MFYIDYANKENYINEVFKNAKSNEVALEILNKESFNLNVQRSLINEIYLDLLMFLDTVLISSKRYLGTKTCDYRGKNKEIIEKIKIKISETETKLNKAVHTEIDLFKDGDENKELTLYKRLVKFNKFPRYFKQKKIDDYKFFLGLDFEDCFGACGLYNLVNHAIRDLYFYVDSFEELISEEGLEFEQAEKNSKYFRNDLPVFIKRSKGGIDYSFLLLEFLKRLRKIYNKKVIHLSLT